MSYGKKNNHDTRSNRSAEALEARLQALREAQRKFSSYSQEQVDRIFFEAAMAANKARIPLAKMAVEETGMGVVEDKVIKNHYAAEYTYNYYKYTKTCGVIEEDTSYGIKKSGRTDGCDRGSYPHHKSHVHCNL